MIITGRVCRKRSMTRGYDTKEGRIFIIYEKDINSREMKKESKDNKGKKESNIVFSFILPVPSCSSANNVAMDGGGTLLGEEAEDDPTLLPGITVAEVLRARGIHSSISLPSKTFNKASFRANKLSLRGGGATEDGPGGPRPRAREFKNNNGKEKVFKDRYNISYIEDEEKKI